MGKNKGAAKALTQEEIWDDSALVQSWDEAVEEYKLYHSIHAKGENVEDVLREAQEAAEAEAAPALSWAPVEKDDDMADVDAAEPTAVETHAPQMTNGPAQSKLEPPAGTAPQAPPMPLPGFPQGQDEGLKNLMMAWYYAGYYTALYEEQQRASQNSKSS
ncbi:hypothetical protein ASPVEDRAFT_73409 [Aspergillus versicolor CBS 583.65]|uniref:Survival Motor Neuron Gemin2-binding domain-containing protein n=1 Tax=Aspergillus versicolor CBS 583.65 TaxID=1036611 RepID=A0A1L9PQG4_ASPVE|nr:uncharacterized protein ASPVEDRAFT_73409 [Aspergillus versicolor CBS 583.65]OJJ03778.1 hypothetical protein ASPVEDRAFT_73409 [Aspergillus versicolor CBS 583.65]